MANQQMLLSEVLRSFSPVYPAGGDWTATRDYLLRTQSEMMADLQKSIITYGFRNPVILARHSDVTDELCVLDGTHRVVCAMLAGLKSIPVVYGYPHDDKLDFVTLEVFLYGAESDDPFEDVFVVLESFELNPDTWARCESASGTRTTVSLSYIDLTEGHIEALKETATRKLYSAGFTEFRLKAYVDNFDDE